jgi:hypothetical protein
MAADLRSMFYKLKDLKALRILRSWTIILKKINYLRGVQISKLPDEYLLIQCNITSFPVYIEIEKSYNNIGYATCAVHLPVGLHKQMFEIAIFGKPNDRQEWI